MLDCKKYFRLKTKDEDRKMEDIPKYSAVELNEI